MNNHHLAVTMIARLAKQKTYPSNGKQRSSREDGLVRSGAERAAAAGPPAGTVAGKDTHTRKLRRAALRQRPRHLHRARGSRAGGRPLCQVGAVRAAIEIVHGRSRIIAGAGSNSTSQAVELTRRAEAAGADAVLSVVPYYNKPMQAGIEAHFRAVAQSTGLPIILHDIPSRTVRELADDTLARLAQSKQFIGLRDGTGDVTCPMHPSALVPPGFRLLSGDDSTALAFMASGGDGCISMISNVAPPGHFRKLRERLAAVCAIFATPARTTDRRARQGEPGRPEICLVPARLHVAHDPPADR